MEIKSDVIGFATVVSIYSGLLARGDDEKEARMKAVSLARDMANMIDVLQNGGTVEEVQPEGDDDGSTKA